MRVSILLLRISVLAVFLAGCESSDNESNIPDTVAAPESTSVSDLQAEQSPEEWEAAFQRQRLIGDLLYDALRALEEDRLLTPVDDNAHARYQRVLAIDPGNELALEGLQNIIMRYIELAETASRQGRYPTAQLLLDRARFVDFDDPVIRDAQRALETEMNSGDLVFELDPVELGRQSATIQARLADIAAQAVELEALVWITALNDEQGRWIYGVMRESTNGYRLRGNIELGSHAIVRLRTPRPAMERDGQAHNDAR